MASMAGSEMTAFNMEALFQEHYNAKHMIRFWLRRKRLRAFYQKLDKYSQDEISMYFKHQKKREAELNEYIGRK